MERLASLASPLICPVISRLPPFLHQISVPLKKIEAAAIG
jgi:hypothetical protein